jgi:glycosyltransferase involved in cell wall biosynthesis
VPDVRPFLARATVFVCPLRLGAGIKNKVLEALAMGLPVVATPLSVDGIEVQPGRDALIVRDDELAEAVVRVLQDAALRERLSTSGRALVAAQYSWEQVAARYEALYAAL